MSAPVKTVCPVSREEFRQKAEPITLTVAGTTIVMDPREFSTGSLGWNASQKVTVVIDGKRVTCQLGLNLTLANSKELPQ